MATSNPGGGLAGSLKAELDDLRRRAVEIAREHMLRRRNERSVELGAALRESVRRLAAWRRSAAPEPAAVDAKGRKLRADEIRRMENRKSEVETIYQSRFSWINDSLRVGTRPPGRLIPRPLGSCRQTIERNGTLFDRRTSGEWLEPRDTTAG